MKQTATEKLRARPVRPPRVPLWLAAPLVCALFALACAAVGGGLAGHDENAAETSQTSGYELTQLVPEGLGTPVLAEISADGESWTLVASNDGYMLRELDLPADEGKAKAVLACGASILARQKVEGAPADFGLAEGEGVQVRFTYETGETFTLRLGKAPVTGEGRYAQVNGEKEIYVVNASLYATLHQSALSLLALPSLEWLNAQTMREVVIARPQAETVAIRRVTEENPFNIRAELTQPFRYPANSERAAELYLNVAQLEVQSVASVGGALEVDEVLAEITVEDGEGETHALTLARQGDTALLLLAGDSHVYAVPYEQTSFLQKQTAPYLAEQLPGLVALNQVESVTVTRGEEVHTLSVEGEGEQARYLVDGEEAEVALFRRLYQQLIGVLVERYAAEDLPEGPARVTFRYALKSGDTWELTFLQGENGYDVIEREGVRRFLISSAKVDAAVDAIAHWKESEENE